MVTLGRVMNKTGGLTGGGAKNFFFTMLGGSVNPLTAMIKHRKELNCSNKLF